MKHHIRAAAFGALLVASAVAAENEAKPAAPVKSHEPEPSAEQPPVQLETILVIGTPQENDRASAATKTDTPLVETPQSISVITRDQLDAQNSNSLQDALRYSPGITGAQLGFDTRSETIQIRGFNVVQTSLYQDGLQLRSRSSFFQPFQLDPFGAERIEVLRGPSSVLYGQNGPGGIVNYVSKRPTTTPQYDLRLQAGSFNRLQAAVDFSGPALKDDPSGTLLYRLTALGRQSDTQVDFVEDNRLFVAPALTWQPNKDLTLTLLSRFQDDSTDFSVNFLPASGTLLDNPNGRIPPNRNPGEPGFNKFERTQASLGYALDYRLGDSLMLRQNVRYDHLDSDTELVAGAGLDPADAAQRTLLRYSNPIHTKHDVFALDNQTQIKMATGPVSHTILIGLDYQRNNSDQQQGFDFVSSIDVFNPIYGQPVPEVPLFEDSVIQSDQVGLYAQDQIKLDDRLVVLLGGRYDHADTEVDDRLANTVTDQQDDAFTGRAGLVYLFPSSGLAPYLSYSESFQPVLGRNVSGAFFEPETGEQYEVGVKFQPPGSSSFAAISGYELLRRNVLTSDPSDPSNQQQTGEVRSRGIEIEAVASLTSGLEVRASYAHVDAEVTKSNAGDEGKAPRSVPEDTASLWGTYAVQSGLLRRLILGVGVRYVGANFGNPENTLEVPDYVLLDSTVRYTWQRIQFSVDAQNLLDEEHVVSCFDFTSCSYGPVRGVTASVGYRW